MKIFVLCVAIYILSFHNKTFGVVIKYINISGNIRVDAEFVKTNANIQIDQNIEATDIITIINKLYATEYFSDIKAYIDKENLNIEVKENPIINAVYIDGSNLIKYDQIKNNLLIRPRATYAKNKIKSDVDKIKLLYQQYGMMSVSVEPKIVFLEDNFVDIIFEIEEGEPMRINKILIHGNNKISRKEILKTMKLKQKNLFNPFSKGSEYSNDLFEIDLENITKFYKDLGFIDVKIDNFSQQFAPDSDTALLNIKITEGNTYKINKIYITNKISDLKDDFSRIKFLQKKGNVYLSHRSEKDKLNIENYLYKQGFGYVTLKENLIKKDDTLDIEYIISDDETYTINSVVINGNIKTNDRIIRRELLFSEGSTLIPYDLDRSKMRLQSLGYFKDINIKQNKNPKNKTIDLEVTLEEDRRRDMINLSAGYSSFEGKILSLGFSKANIFGSGYDFMTDLSTSKITQGLNFGLNTARFGESKFGGGINFGFSKFDATPYGISYVSKSKYIAPTISYRLGDNLFHSFTYSYREDQMQNEPREGSIFLRTLLLNQFKNIVTSSITNVIAYDTRDNWVLPYSGSRLSIGQTIAGIGGDQKFIRHDFEAKTYRQILGKKSPFMISIRAGHVQGYGNSDVLFQNRYMLNSYNIRGFDYGGMGPRLIETTSDGKKYMDVISYRGNTYGVLTFEQHFPVPMVDDIGMRMYLFSDFATLYGFDGKKETINYLGNKEEIIDSKSIRNASGMGVAIPTPFGVIKLDYSYKVKSEYYDSVQQFKISIGDMPLN